MSDNLSFSLSNVRPVPRLSQIPRRTQDHGSSQVLPPSTVSPTAKSTPATYAAKTAIFNVERDHYSKTSYSSTTTNYINFRDTSEESILADIPYAPGAAFKPEKACLPGTRLAILQTIIDWVEDPDGAALLWLIGFAGAGKSAVAHAIAQYFYQKGRLGSSFFFDRAHQTSRHTQNLFSTIGRDVICLDPVREWSFLDIIRNNRGLRTTHSPHRQFHELLLAPKGSPDAKLPIVIVVDALDESGNQEDRAEILSILGSEQGPWRNYFRFLVTSRFEQDISAALFDNSNIDMERMHDIDRQSTDADIYQMLSKLLPDIPALDVQYPNNEWRHMLVRKAEGIFQWAATACRVILGSGKRRNPCTQFMALMAAGSQLYSLYLAVLNNLFDSQDENDMATFRTVMGAVLVAREPLTLKTIKELFPEEYPDFVIKSLGSLLTGTADGGTITPLHTSFRDFLIDSTQAEAFWVDLTVSSQRMSLSTLKCMNRNLHFNMGNCQSSYFPSLLTAPLPPHVVYSCRFWAEYLDPVGSSTDILESMTIFFHSNFLYWLEVLSLTKSVSLAWPSLTIATKVTDTNISDFAKDARRFVATFAPPISLNTAHIYVSALPFTPLSSKVRKHYLPSFPNTIRLTKGERHDWPALQSILQGHDDYVTSVAFSPDGSRIVSGARNATIRIWEGSSGEQIGKQLVGHDLGVTSCTFSPDGSRVVSASFDKSIRIWDASSGIQIGKPLIGHLDCVTSVAFSPNGSYIASGSRDYTIRIWDTSSGKQMGQPLDGHDHYVTSIAFSPDGSQITSSSEDSTVRIWDTLSHEQVKKQHIKHVILVTISRIVSCPYDPSSMQIWNASSGKKVGKPLVGHNSKVTSAAFSSDGSYLVSGSADKTIRIWSASSGDQIGHPLVGHEYNVTSVAFSPDSTRVISGSHDHTIRTWDLSSVEQIRKPPVGHDNNVTSVAVSPDGSLIASGSWDATIRIWDALSGEPVLQPLAGHASSVTSVAFSLDGFRIASGSMDQTVAIWDAISGDRIGQWFMGHIGNVTSVVFSPDSSFVISGSWDKTLRIWDVSASMSQDKQPLQALEHGSDVTSVALSPDGSLVVVASWDHAIQVLNLKTGRNAVQPLIGHSKGVNSVVFSPDGSHIASGSSDHVIRIWELTSGKEIGQGLVGHDNVVTSVAFSPNGCHIASGSWDKTIRVWSMWTGKLVGQPLFGHEKGVNTVTFSSFGTHIISASHDKTIRVWNFRETNEQAEFSQLENQQLFECSPGPTSPYFSRFDTSAEPKNDETETSLSLQSLEIAFGHKIGNASWVTGPQGELLFWLPPSHRKSLYRPNTSLIIGGDFEHTQLDLTRFVHGIHWQSCRRIEGSE